MPFRPGSCAAFVCLSVYLSTLYAVPGSAADDSSSLDPVLLLSGNARAGGCLSCLTHAEHQCHRSRSLGRTSSPFAHDFVHLCTHVGREASISAAASRCCVTLDCHGQQAVVRDSVATPGDMFAAQLQSGEFDLHHHLYPSVASRCLREARHCNVRAASGAVQLVDRACGRPRHIAALLHHLEFGPVLGCGGRARRQGHLRQCPERLATVSLRWCSSESSIIAPIYRGHGVSCCLMQGHLPSSPADVADALAHTACRLPPARGTPRLSAHVHAVMLANVPTSDARSGGACPLVRERPRAGHTLLTRFPR